MGNQVLVSETITGSAIYQGSAVQTPIGSDWDSRISYQFVPEPASWLSCCAGLLAALGLRSLARRK
jgi:hypothetical protein